MLLHLFAAAPGMLLSPTDASRALLSRAQELPVHLTSPEDRSEVERLASAAENALTADARPQLPRDSEALCHRWKLICTTRTAGSEPLQVIRAQPALGTFSISQRFRPTDDASVLRCDNIVTIGRPDDGFLSTWTLMPAGGQSALTLQHEAKVVNDGTDGAQPLRLSITLDAVVLDGNRRAGDPQETIVAVPLPPRLLPDLPALPSPPLPPAVRQAVADAGTFDVTLVDESLRVVRGVGGELRIFERVGNEERQPTW